MERGLASASAVDAVSEEAWGTWDLCSEYPQEGRTDRSRSARADLFEETCKNLLGIIIPLDIYPLWHLHPHPPMEHPSHQTMSTSLKPVDLHCLVLANS